MRRFGGENESSQCTADNPFVWHFIEHMHTIINYNKIPLIRGQCNLTKITSPISLKLSTIAISLNHNPFTIYHGTVFLMCTDSMFLHTPLKLMQVKKHQFRQQKLMMTLSHWFSEEVCKLSRGGNKRVKSSS